MLEPWFLNNI